MKYISLSLFLILGFLSVSCPLHSFHSRNLKIINLTGERLGILSLNKPFRRSDATNNNLVWLNDQEKISYITRGRVLGWWKRGLPAKFTIIDRNDSVIAFVRNNGEIKTLHGAIKEIEVENTRAYPVDMYTKNPNAGEENCVECVNDCYDEDGTLDFCSCLNTCWDRTRDLTWRVDAGEILTLLASKGTKIGVAEDDVCSGEVCYQKVTTTWYE